MTFRRFVATSLLALMAFSASAGIASAAEKAPTAKLNINTASVEQLTALPGIGPKLAARIVDHRQKEGPFKTTQELMNVKGVGQKNFAKLQGYLNTGEPAARGASR